jgi:hypothetical protein
VEANSISWTIWCVRKRAFINWASNGRRKASPSERQ